MPNRSSHAGHLPTRTCVVCRGKYEQSSLLSIAILREGMVLELKRALPGRKNYVCPETSCLSGIERWAKKYKKKIKTSAVPRENQSGK